MTPAQARALLELVADLYIVAATPDPKTNGHKDEKWEEVKLVADTEQPDDVAAR